MDIANQISLLSGGIIGQANRKISLLTTLKKLKCVYLSINCPQFSIKDA
jgi:hypothetical protein